MAAPEGVIEKLLYGGSWLAGFASLGQITSKFIPLTKPAGIIDLVTKFPRTAKYLEPMASSGLTLGIYGQLDPDLENRLDSLVKDIALGSAFGGLGLIPKTGARIPAAGLLGAGLTKLDGGSDEDAAVNSVLFMAGDLVFHR